MESLLNSQGATGDIGGVPCAHHRIIRCVGNRLVCWLVIRGGGVENRTTPVVDESHHILNRASDVLCVCVCVREREIEREKHAYILYVITHNTYS